MPIFPAQLNYANILQYNEKNSSQEKLIYYLAIILIEEGWRFDTI